MLLQCTLGGEIIFQIPEKTFEAKSAGVFVVVRQESQAARKALGEWRPLGLVEVNTPGTIYWSLSHANPVSDQFKICLTIRHATDGYRALAFQNTSSNSIPDSLLFPPSPLFTEEDDDIFIKWYVSEESPVDLRMVKVFFFKESAQGFDLRDKISVSRAVGGGAVVIAPTLSIGTPP